MAKKTRSKLLRDYRKLDTFDLPRRTIDKIYKIIAFCGTEHKKFYEIGKHLDITVNEAEQTVRLAQAYIMKFQNPTGQFWLAKDKTGAYITKDNITVAHYLKYLKDELELTKMQIIQAELILLNNTKKEREVNNG